MPLDPMRQIIRGNDALVSCTLATRRISGEGKDQDGAGGLAMVGVGGLASCLVRQGSVLAVTP